MFINTALANSSIASTTIGSMISAAMPLIIFVLVFYFLLMKPQQKKVKEHKSMLDALKIGDKVLTASGIKGKIAKLGEEYVTLEIADKVQIEIMKEYIASSFEKRETKELTKKDETKSKTKKAISKK